MSEKARRRKHNSKKPSRRRFLKTTGVAAGGITVTLAGCAGSGGGGDSQDASGDGASVGTTNAEDSKLVDKINVYSFGGTNGEAVRKAYARGFEEEYGVEVEHRSLASGWDLLPKIENDSVTAHVIENNPDSALAGIEQGIYQKIRKENIPNVIDRYQFDELKPDSDATTFDPGEDWHHVTKELFAQGLTYNTDQMDKPSSWSDIYTEQTKDFITNTVFTTLAIGAAAHEAGVNFNNIESDPNVAEQIWNRISEQNEYVYQWWDSGSTAQQLFTSESAIAGNFWYGRVYGLREDDDVPVQYIIPEEGTVYAPSTWTIGVESEPDRYTAEKFVDFTSDPVASRKYAEIVPYTQAFPVEDPPSPYENNPDKENLDKMRMWDYTLVGENQKKWEKKFQELISS
jgi:spermidine/putrescine-binding protein